MFVYHEYDGVGLAELIARKEVSREEVREEAIAALEELNPQLNAVVHKTYNQGQAERTTDKKNSFLGVPVLLKNIIQESKGELITSGSYALKDYRAKEDSNFVKRLRATGVTFLGHTNVPELALMGVTEPKLYGPTRNPWNTDYTPGGSSGGSAAAVAAGIVPIAGANDGGGSIRIPAAYCGLFGLKPSRGRNPVGRSLGRHWQGASSDHIVSRSVRDSARMLDLLKGYEKGAAFHAPPLDANYEEILNSRFNKQLRIAYSLRSPIGTDVDPECIGAVVKTVKLLESMGHFIEEAEPPVDGRKLANSYITMYFGEVAAALSSMKETVGREITSKDVEPTTWLLAILGKATTAEEWVMNLREWDKAAYIMEEFHEKYDFYITPTTAYPPAKIGELDPSASEKRLINLVGKLHLGSLMKKKGLIHSIVENSLKRTPFTQLANLTGQPAMSVPLHLTQDGLPVGVQFIAANGREDLLFQMAAQLEQSPLWENYLQNPVFKEKSVEKSAILENKV